MTAALPSPSICRAVPSTTSAFADVARELLSAAEDVKGVQEALHGITLEILSSNDIVKLQALDKIEQTIRALAHILFNVSIDGAAGVKLHLEDCNLSALVNSLSNRSMENDTSIELF